MRITFNKSGFDSLLTSPGAQQLLEEHTEHVAERANSIPSTTSPAHDAPYYKVEDGSDGKRARRRVVTDGPRAAAHEAKTQALLRAIS